jgi:hypothetical protein
MSGAQRAPVFEARQAALAAGIPMRRLQGWLDRKVFAPSVGASGRGSRRKFTRGDIVALAIIAELQAILGSHLRPGVLAQEVTDWVEKCGAKTFLMFSLRDGYIRTLPGDAESVQHHLKRSPSTIVVNLDVLGQRVDARLGAG